MRAPARCAAATTAGHGGRAHEVLRMRMQRRRARSAGTHKYLGQNAFVQLEHLAVQRKHRRAAERIPACHSSWKNLPKSHEPARIFGLITNSHPSNNEFAPDGGDTSPPHVGQVCPNGLSPHVRKFFGNALQVPWVPRVCFKHSPPP